MSVIRIAVLDRYGQYFSIKKLMCFNDILGKAKVSTIAYSQTLSWNGEFQPPVKYEIKVQNITNILNIPQRADSLIQFHSLKINNLIYSACCIRLPYLCGLRQKQVHNNITIETVRNQLITGI